MKPLHLKIILLAGCLILGGVVFVIAQDDPFAKLTYPIPELGNCSDKKSCEAYCDKSKNMKSCLNFAETHNLLPEKEIETGQRMLALSETKGPGGCQGRESCEAYCDQIDNIKECIVFAEENNLIPQDELEEAKKVIQAIDRGLTPPKCKGKKACDIYCYRPENMEACINFAKEAGLMPLEESQEAEKVLEAIKKGAKPPACTGKKACDLYCSQPEHMGECIEFGIAAGFMPSEEAENAKKTLEAIKKGVRPPDCQGKEECDVYCSQEEHREECLNFAEAAGFISPEEAKRAREGGAGGPGGCKTEEECEAFCSKPENMEICIDFAVKRGEISSEEAEKMRQGAGGQMPTRPGGCKTPEECQTFCQNPENAKECMQFAPEGESGGAPGAPAIPGAPESGTRRLPSGFEGKCSTPEGCMQYCSQNLQDPACQAASGFPGKNVAPPLPMPGGQMPLPPPPEGTTSSPGTMPPPPEGQAPQFPPPSETPPQSFLDQVKYFLANIISALGF